MDFLIQRYSPQRHSGVSLLAFALFVIAFHSGCSKEKLEEMAAAVQDQAAKVQDQAKNVQQQARDMAASTPLADVIPASGRAEIGLPSPVESGSGYVRLYVIGDGRPSVVQFTSYDPDAGPHTFPALLVRATTDAASPQTLHGKTLDADVFLQTAADGPVMTLAPGTTAAFSISAGGADGSQNDVVVARASSVNLVDTSGNTTVANQIVVEGRLP